MTQTFTKTDLIQKLQEIKARGWIPNARPGNHGGVGNTLEDLLGIEENNLPIPNASEWELKCQRQGTSALTTLFHSEPSPRAIRFVPAILLPQYGWSHQQAGSGYTVHEKSFRQTINAAKPTDRGFRVVVDRATRRIVISFDATKVAEKHAVWLNSVARNIGLGELNPQPYWGFDDLFHIMGTKLPNTFYVIAQRKRINGIEHFHYVSAKMLTGLSQENIIQAIEAGKILVDFDARSGHNHGTKFRMRQNTLPELYASVTDVM